MDVDDMLVFFGGTVKALGDGRVGGHLVRFSAPETPDLSGEYFVPATDFWFDGADTKTLRVLYHHNLDPTIKVREGRGSIIGKAEVGLDDVGVWIRGVLDLRDDYERAIYGMVEAGKMGWSSGSANHLVAKKSVDGAREVLSWPLVEASITPIPCEPSAVAVALKSVAAPTFEEMVALMAAKPDPEPGPTKGMFEAELVEQETERDLWSLTSTLCSVLDDLADIAETDGAEAARAALAVILAEFGARVTAAMVPIIDAEGAMKSDDGQHGVRLAVLDEVARAALRGASERAERYVKRLSARWTEIAAKAAADPDSLKIGAGLSQSRRQRIEATCKDLESHAAMHEMQATEHTKRIREAAASLAKLVTDATSVAKPKALDSSEALVLYARHLEQRAWTA